MKDIIDRQDIEHLVDEFYEHVRNNSVLSPYFDDLDWNQHLPTMYSFWESILFQTGNFQGNPMMKHINLHQSMPLSNEAFEAWLKLFNQTVDELYTGDHAELIKTRALSIATVIRLKTVYAS